MMTAATAPARARPSPHHAAAPDVAPERVDPRRSTERDPAYLRVRDGARRRLDASLRQLVGDLRRASAAERDGVLHAFVRRHVAILRDAYAAGHALGAREYYAGVSRHPARWAARIEPDAQATAKRLAFYAPSAAKMAHEAGRAAAKLHDGAKTFADDPPATPEADPLDEWFVGATGRADLQADVAWPGRQDGYSQAGAADAANPYRLIAWRLEPSAMHCQQCPLLAANGPYDPPGSGGNELWQTPGDGHTDCGAGCKCDLEYVAMPAEDFRTSIWGEGPPDGPPTPADVAGEDVPAAVAPPALGDEITPAMAKAMDDYRAAGERWEQVRGPHPALPKMFDPASHGANWPAWESLTGAQRLALRDVYQSLVDWEKAAGAVPLEQAVAANAAAQADLAAFQHKMEAMADHLDRFVEQLNAAAERDTLERFGVGVFKMWLNNLRLDFEEDLDWFYGRALPGQPSDAELERQVKARLAQIAAQLAKYDAERAGGTGGAGGQDGGKLAGAIGDGGMVLFNPNHLPAGSPQGGEFGPAGGGGAGGAEAGVPKRVGKAGVSPRAAMAQEMADAADRVEHLRDQRAEVARLAGVGDLEGRLRNHDAAIQQSLQEYRALRVRLGLPQLRALGPLPNVDAARAREAERAQSDDLGTRRSAAARVASVAAKREAEVALRHEWRRTADPDRFAELDKVLRQRAAWRAQLARRAAGTPGKGGRPPGPATHEGLAALRGRIAELRAQRETQRGPERYRTGQLLAKARNRADAMATALGVTLPPELRETVGGWALDEFDD